MQRINEVDIWFSEKIIKNYKHLAKFIKGMRKKFRNENRNNTTDTGDIYRLIKTEFKIYKLPNWKTYRKWMNFNTYAIHWNITEMKQLI